MIVSIWKRSIRSAPTPLSRSTPWPSSPRVVEAGGFSAAARDFGLSKAAVSKRVARLEDRLGARLLNRTTRRLSLTEAGEAFYSGCRRMVREAESAQEAVTHLVAAPRGTLRVNAPMSFGQLHLAAGPERLPDAPPRVGGGSQPGRPRGQSGARGLRRRAFVSKPLQDASLIAPPTDAFPGARLRGAQLSRRPGAAPTRPEALAGHACLIYSYQSRPGVWTLTGPQGERRVRVDGRLRANNGEALREAAIAGFGLALLPTFIVGEDVRQGRLQPVLRDWTAGSPVAVHAVFPASRNLSPKVRAFVDFLAERFGQEPYWVRRLWAWALSNAAAPNPGSLR